MLRQIRVDDLPRISLQTTIRQMQGQPIKRRHPQPRTTLLRLQLPQSRSSKPPVKHVPHHGNPQNRRMNSNLMRPKKTHTSLPQSPARRRLSQKTKLSKSLFPLGARRNHLGLSPMRQQRRIRQQLPPHTVTPRTGNKSKNKRTLRRTEAVTQICQPLPTFGKYRHAADFRIHIVNRTEERRPPPQEFRLSRLQLPIERSIQIRPHTIPRILPHRNPTRLIQRDPIIPLSQNRQPQGNIPQQRRRKTDRIDFTLLTHRRFTNEGKKYPRIDKRVRGHPLGGVEKLRSRKLSATCLMPCDLIGVNKTGLTSFIERGDESARCSKNCIFVACSYCNIELLRQSLKTALNLTVAERAAFRFTDVFESGFSICHD